MKLFKDKPKSFPWLNLNIFAGQRIVLRTSYSRVIGMLAEVCQSWGSSMDTSFNFSSNTNKHTQARTHTQTQAQTVRQTHTNIYKYTGNRKKGMGVRGVGEWGGGQEEGGERERLLVACLFNVLASSVSQGQICSDNFRCCHTEIEVADQTFHLTQSQYTDTRPTSPCTDPKMPGAWQGSHWCVNF